MSSGTTGFSAAGQGSGIPRLTHAYLGPGATMETLTRVSRLCNAGIFVRNYKFVDGEKSCITSDGMSYSWKDKCYNRIWIGVHGKESICMVTLKAKDVDMPPVDAPYYNKYCLNRQTMRNYAGAIISDVECIPYDSVMADKIEKPFAVVSVIPYTVHEGSSDEVISAEYDKEKAIKFLEDKMKSNLAFTFHETVETAISAFQHLCCKELKVEDIWVSTAWNIDSDIDHMRLPERKEYLDIISGVSSGEGRPPKVLCGYLCPPSIPSGPVNGSGWFVGEPVLNNGDFFNPIPYSTQCPLSRGGGCSDSDDDDNDRARPFPKFRSAYGVGGVKLLNMNL